MRSSLPFLLTHPPLHSKLWWWRESPPMLYFVLWFHLRVNETVFGLSRRQKGVKLLRCAAYLLADTSHRARVCRNINRFHTEPSGGFCFFFLLCSLSISPRASSLIKPCAASVQLRSGKHNEAPAVDNLVPWLMPRRQKPFGFKAVRGKYLAKKENEKHQISFHLSNDCEAAESNLGDGGAENTRRQAHRQLVGYIWHLEIFLRFAWT